MPNAAHHPGHRSTPSADLESDPVGDRIDRLVEAAVAGDRVATAELMGELRPLVVRFCANRLHRGSTFVEDVAQEVCTAVITALPRYRQMGRPFLAYVQAIALHKIAHAVAAASRQREVPVAEVPDRAGGSDDPEQCLLRAHSVDQMCELLRRLTANQRDVVFLRVLGGYSAAEIGRLLDHRPEAVRLIQHRAIGRLRGLLGHTSG